MKYLKLFENYQSESEVAEICEKFRIKNWSLVDGLVNVDGDVTLTLSKITNIPLKFGTVTGNFFCSSNYLSSLEGCPNRVGGEFDCRFNEITSLEGCPKSVGGDFYCYDNNIREFTGIKYIGGDLICYNNPIGNIWKIINSDNNRLPLRAKWNEEQMDLFEDCSVIQDDGESVAIDRLNFFLEEMGLPTVESVEGYKNIY